MTTKRPKTAEAELGQLKTAALYLAEDLGRQAAAYTTQAGEYESLRDQLRGRAEAARLYASTIHHLVAMVEDLPDDAPRSHVLSAVHKAIGQALEEEGAQA